MIKRARGFISHPLFSGSALMMGGSMVVNGVNYLYHLLMGRLLGPVEYGVLASIFSILYIIGIVPTSSSFAIVKFISSAKNLKEKAAVYHTIKKLLLYIAVAGFVLTVLLSPLIANFLHIEKKINVALVGPILFLSLITLVNQATLQGQLKFMGVVAPNFVSGFVKLVLGLIFVLLGFSVTGAIGGILIAALLAYLLSVKMMSKDIVKESKKTFDLKPFFKYAFPVLLQALAFTSFFTVDVILVRHFLPPFEAGLYAALSTLGKIIYFAAVPITSVMFPIIAGRKSRGEHYRKVFFASFFLTIAISLVIVSFYYLFPQIAIGLLYGKEYLSAKSELVWMGGFMAIYTVSSLLVNFLLSINRTKAVIFPLVAFLGQLIGIIIWHESILQVIQVSLVAMITLFFGLIVYLGYIEQTRIYAKKR